MRYISGIIVALLCLATAGPALAQPLLAAVPPVAADAAPPARAVINIPSRTLTFYANGQAVREYPVGVGRVGHQTPLGTFKISYKEFNPVWIEPVAGSEEPRIIPSGPNNPLGYRWMEFAPYYGVHGTNDPSSIGGYVSNGCVRMLEADVEELYEKVPLGMPLEIKYDRLVFREAQGGAVTLTVYPDAYGLQPLDAAAVYRRLREYQAEALVGRAEIEAALTAGRSAEIRVGRVFSLMVFGKKLPDKGFSLDGADYVPVLPVSVEAKVDVAWDAARRMLTSAYGSVPGLDRGDRLYVKAGDLQALFQLYACWYPLPDTLYMDHYAQ